MQQHSDPQHTSMSAARWNKKNLINELTELRANNCLQTSVCWSSFITMRVKIIPQQSEVTENDWYF